MCLQPSTLLTFVCVLFKFKAIINKPLFCQAACLLSVTVRLPVVCQAVVGLPVLCQAVCYAVCSVRLDCNTCLSQPVICLSGCLVTARLSALHTLADIDRDTVQSMKQSVPTPASVQNKWL